MAEVCYGAGEARSLSWDRTAVTLPLLSSTTMQRATSRDYGSRSADDYGDRGGPYRDRSNRGGYRDDRMGLERGGYGGDVDRGDYGSSAQGGSSRDDYDGDYARGGSVLDRGQWAERGGTDRDFEASRGDVGMAYDEGYGSDRSAYGSADYGRGGVGVSRGSGGRYDSRYDRDDGPSRGHSRSGYGMAGDGERAPHVGKGPKGYERSSERTVEDVSERLMWNGDLDASEIEVSCDDGEVTLEGTVDSRQAKRTAEDLAESVRGVRDVHNRLRIDRGGGEAVGTGATSAEAEAEPGAGAKERAKRS